MATDPKTSPDLSAARGKLHAELAKALSDFRAEVGIINNDANLLALHSLSYFLGTVGAAMQAGGVDSERVSRTMQAGVDAGGIWWDERVAPEIEADWEAFGDEPTAPMARRGS